MTYVLLDVSVHLESTNGLSLCWWNSVKYKPVRAVSTNAADGVMECHVTTCALYLIQFGCKCKLFRFQSLRHFDVWLVLQVTSDFASDQSVTDSVAPIRNGKGGKNRWWSLRLSFQTNVSDLCAFTATEPGRYLLSGLAKRPWHQPYCTVYIRSPPQTRIRLTFDYDQIDCEKSILSVNFCPDGSPN